MKNANILMLAGLFAAGLPVWASAATQAHEGYLVDSNGNIVRSGDGSCWHTGDWTPAMAVAGCDKVAMASVAASPEVKAVVALPKPVIAIVQQKVTTQKVTFSEKDLFKFGKAVLNQHGKAMLNNLISSLGGVKYDVIHVTGYTDPIGSIKYNQQLSLRRADAVMKYLVQHGIPSDRIDAEGRGKTQLIATFAECKGLTKAKTIACLQPDRRTEVVVTGTEQSSTNRDVSSMFVH